jgi:hypothetical protein
LPQEINRTANRRYYRGEGQLQKCHRINRRRLMSQRLLTRQQVVGDADPLLNCAGRQMEDELRAE